MYGPSNRILLVEDNFINQEVARGILEDLNITVDIAGDGLEAIALLKTMSHEAPYQLVLMDCQMPEMDGYEATHSVRQGRAGEASQDIPIIAMTANAMKGDKEKCLAAGMNDYLSKPIDPDELEAMINQWLGRVSAKAPFREGAGSTIDNDE
ncbi:MAG: response regulator [Pseudomonadales bacterium]